MADGCRWDGGIGYNVVASAWCLCEMFGVRERGEKDSFITKTSNSPDL